MKKDERKKDDEMDKDEMKASAELPRSIESHFNCTVTSDLCDLNFAN